MQAEYLKTMKKQVTWSNTCLIFFKIGRQSNDKTQSLNN